MDRTAPSPGRFFYEQTMSEEDKDTAAPLAAESERTETQDTEETTAAEAAASENDAEKPETAEGEDTDEADDAEDDGEKDRPKKPGRSERLRRQNERLQARIAALESGSAIAAVQDQASIDAVVAKKLGPEPKEADFNGDWFKYERAMNAYEAAKLTVSLQVKEQAGQAQFEEQARVQDLLDDFNDNVAKVAKAIPDFTKVVSRTDFVTTEQTKRLILDAGEKAPLVSYHLAQNPRLCARINALPLHQAAREIGRVEGLVSLPKKTATRAPAPLTAVKGAAPSRSIGRSMSDYERWRNS